MKNDLKFMGALFAKRHVKLPSHVLEKMRGYISGAEKPSEDTLNRLALLAGFQSWNDFRDALHGKDDASVNYEGKR